MVSYKCRQGYTETSVFLHFRRRISILVSISSVCVWMKGQNAEENVCLQNIRLRMDKALDTYL